MKGQKFLKITGIIMIIGGALGAIFGLIALAGIGALAQWAGSSEGAGFLYAASGLAAAGGVLQIIAGVTGVKHCANPAKAQTCIVWGAVVAALCVLTNILYMVGGNGFQLSSVALGLVLPALYIYGAVLNKKEIQ